VQTFFELVKSSIFCAPPKFNSEWLTTTYRRSGSSKVVTSNRERRQGTLSHNAVLRYLSTAFDNENYFSWAPKSTEFWKILQCLPLRRIKRWPLTQKTRKLILSGRGYEIAAERDVLCECPQTEFITNFERWRSCCSCWRPTGRQRMDIELPKACRWRQKTRLDEDFKGPIWRQRRSL